MTLIFAEGFDNVTDNAGSSPEMSDIFDVVQGVNVHSFATAGRFGGGAMGCDNGSSVTVLVDPDATKNYQTMIMGIAFQYNAFFTYPIFILQNIEFDVFVAVRTLATGQIQIENGAGGVLATSVGTFGLNVWNFLEMKATIGGTGSCEVRLNQAANESVPFVEVSGVNLSQTGSIRRAIIGSNDTPIQQGSMQDDMHICDILGPDNNDFLGDGRIHQLRPNADATPLQWTPLGGGTHFSEIDEVTVDDSNYNFTTTDGAEDRYDKGSLPAGNEAVQFALVNTRALRLSGAGTTFQHSVISQGVQNSSPTQFLGTDAFWHKYVVERDPATAAPWQRSGINNSQTGIKVI